MAMESRIMKKPRVASIAGIYDWSIYNLHFYAILKNKKKEEVCQKGWDALPIISYVVHPYKLSPKNLYTSAL